MDKKIIERIKKMFALANNAGAAPGEAENAMRMANKLMEKYNLSNYDLVNKELITIKFEKYERFQWKKAIFVSVAEIYNCAMFLKGTDNMILVGTESDMVTASIVIHGLIQSIENAGKGKGIGFKNSAAIAISKQCTAIIEERNKDTTVDPGTGLVLSEVYNSKLAKAEEFMNKTFNLGKPRDIISNGRSAEGEAYGNSLNPHAHLSNKVALK